MSDKKALPDAYGFLAALRTGLKWFELASRQSGRSTALANAIKPGDMVIFSCHGHRRHFEQRLKAQNAEKGVLLAVCRPSEIWKCSDFKRVSGQVWFDHDFESAFFQWVVEDGARQKENVRKHLSFRPEGPPEADLGWSSEILKSLRLEQ